MKDDMVTRHIIQLLKEKAIHITEARVNITAIIYRSAKWLSLANIIQDNNNIYDRATVYRVLCLLLDHGFIQKLVDMEKTSYYFFNHEQPASQASSVASEHTYFKCIACGGITVLPDTETAIPVPQGFVKLGGNLIIQGYCNNCAQNNN